MPSVLTVLCPNGRREQIKVNPNTCLLEVLEEACRKQKINPEDFDLSHFNRVLDVTLSVRFSNLTNNSMLTLVPTKQVRKESSVIVGLQLETGERIECSFDPSSTMWDVVEKCLSSGNEVTRKSGVSEEPVCVYMRQQFAGDVLKSTSLRSIGLTSGKAIIRLMYRSPETMQGQAHIAIPIMKASITNPFNSEPALNSKENSRKSPSTEADGGPVHKQACIKSMSKGDEELSEEKTVSKEVEMNTFSVQMSKNSLKESSLPVLCENVVSTNKDNAENAAVPDSSNEKQQSESEMMEVDVSESSEEEREIGEIKYLGLRNALLFNLKDITATKKVDIPDEFFQLTVNDIQYLSNDYKRIREELENQPLLIKSQRDAQFVQQIKSYKQAVIRVYFPNKFVLQGTFFANETVESVMDFVREYLLDQQLPFYLYTTPPKQQLIPCHTLFEAQVVPAAVVHFGTNVTRAAYLRPDIEIQVSDPRAAKHAAEESRKNCDDSNTDGSTFSLNEKPFDTCDSNQPSTSLLACTTPYQRPETDGKVPKWFLQGKK